MAADKLVTVNIATTIQQLSPEVAEVVGFAFLTTHVCMDCGVKVGGAKLTEHAREHAGLPKRMSKRQGASPNGARQ